MKLRWFIVFAFALASFTYAHAAQENKHASNSEIVDNDDDDYDDDDDDCDDEKDCENAGQVAPKTTNDQVKKPQGTGAAQPKS